MADSRTEDLRRIYHHIQGDLDTVVRRIVQLSTASVPNSSSLSTDQLCKENERLKKEIEKLSRLPGPDMKQNSVQGEHSPKKGEHSPAYFRQDSTNSFTKSMLHAACPAGSIVAGPQARTVFPDVQAMKEQLKTSLIKKSYNVLDHYKTEGLAQSIARSRFFEYVTLSVIAVNCVWMAIDTDYNTSKNPLDAPPLFIVMDNLFTVFFVAELAIRCAAFEKKTNCLRDSSFLFDGALVIMMVLETWIMTLGFAIFLGKSRVGSATVDMSALRIIRLVRLTRMARMVRLFRALPELIILIRGIVVASRSVFFTLVLLVLLMYIFSICYRRVLEQVTVDQDLVDTKFSSVWKTMWTLMLDGILPDNAGLIVEVAEESVLLGIMTILFVLLAALTVLNMLVGVLCEVVGVVSTVERETLAVKYVKEKFFEMLETRSLDADTTGLLDRYEFQELLLAPEAARILQEIGVDVIGLVDLTDYLFHEKNVLTFTEFMEVIYQLRGSNAATVKDIVDLRRYMTSMFDKCSLLEQDRGGLGSSPSLEPANGVVKMSFVNPFPDVMRCPEAPALANKPHKRSI